jgi:hypothetical protein
MPHPGVPVLPDRLPPLPETTDVSWSADIQALHNRLSDFFDSSRRALNLDESDPIRVRTHLDRASNTMVSIVEALGLRTEDPLPNEYIHSVALATGSLVMHLRHAMETSKHQ